MLSGMKAERTLTSPPNGEVPVTMLSCISCLKELVKIQASSQLNLLNDLWLLRGKPSSKNILLPLHSLQFRHSNPYYSRGRIVQLETGSKFSVFQRKTLSVFTRLWISPEGASALPHTLLQPTKAELAAAAEKGHESPPWAWHASCSCSWSAMLVYITGNGCPSVTSRRRWLLHNHSFPPYRQANPAKNGTG